MTVGELRQKLLPFNDNMQVIFYDFYNVKYLKLEDEINVQEFEGKCEIAFNGDIDD